MDRTIISIRFYNRIAAWIEEVDSEIVKIKGIRGIAEGEAMESFIDAIKDNLDVRCVVLHPRHPNYNNLANGIKLACDRLGLAVSDL